ncbi:hypothetical protein B0H14DRAFT_1315225 [Mycena olivaceomarginata]|nr:hypothetical protein B0H14DRAFT_1315225 [Mycena olivaceomarginata]
MRSNLGWVNAHGTMRILIWRGRSRWSGKRECILPLPKGSNLRLPCPFSSPCSTFPNHCYLHLHSHHISPHRFSISLSCPATLLPPPLSPSDSSSLPPPPSCPKRGGGGRTTRKGTRLDVSSVRRRMREQRDANGASFRQLDNNRQGRGAQHSESNSYIKVPGSCASTDGVEVHQEARVSSPSVTDASILCGRLTASSARNRPARESTPLHSIHGPRPRASRA